ncbi:MAG: prepilin-type N-terminal cleavage/methylation domain-containing protein [Planctomycetes bacterium]|nr:prepilin-type N-terminal cleavage/methylation domain-containing protein [Planctomycetota bacterium]
MNQRGFTLIELIIVLFVIALMAGTIAPLATAKQRSEHYDRAGDELAAIEIALDAYYYDRASFPSAIDAIDFYGPYLLGGIGDDTIRDEWGGAYYRVALESNPDRCHVWSIGEDGINSGAASEALSLTVEGRVPGDRRTRERLAIIAASLARFVADGGTLTGTWSTDRPAMGLGAAYANDGYGTAFSIDASTRVVTSAGADRVFSTSDDLGT